MSVSNFMSKFTPVYGANFNASEQWVSFNNTGDFNGDGRTDIAVAGWTYAAVDNTVLNSPLRFFLFTQAADGSFVDSTASLVSNATIAGTGEVGVADFNHDGIDDIVLMGFTDFPVIAVPGVVLMSNGSGYTRQDQPTLATHGLALGDWNADGYTDMFAAGYNTDNPLLLYSPGSGTFGVDQSIPPLGGSAASAAIGDLNNDGNADLVLVDAYMGSPTASDIEVFLTGADRAIPSSPTFTVEAQLGVDSHETRARLVDLDRDGFLDLAVYETKFVVDQGQGAQMSLWRNDGTGHFQAVTNLWLPQQVFIQSMDYSFVWQDLDGDGSVDLALAAGAFGSLPQGNNVYLNDGSGHLHLVMHDQFVTMGQQVAAQLQSQSGILVDPNAVGSFRVLPNSTGNLDFFWTGTPFPTSGQASRVSAHVQTNIDLDVELTAAFSIAGTSAGETLHAWAGNDVLEGGAGNDVIAGGLGNDTIYGGQGNDAANYADATGAVTVSLSQGSATGAAGTDRLFEVEGAIGSGSADLLVGSASNDSLFGGADADSLLGGAGDDTIWGGAGGDTIDGGLGTDLADYSSLTGALNIQLHTSLANLGIEGGFDPLLLVENVASGSGSDQIWGNHLANVLTANAGNDWLHGFASNDTLYGGDGSDQVLGGDGADTLYGGTGDDYFWFDYQDAIFGGAGVDYAYATDTNAVTVNLATASLEGVWANNGADFLDASGTSWSVQLIGYGVGDTLRGGVGNDYLWFDELDTISGGGGIDAAYATTANGVTVNYATQGIEQVWATNGNDRLDASGLATDGNYLIAYSGTDTVLGGSGNDYMWVDWDASDTMSGGAGRDEMYQIGTGAVSLDLGARGIEAVLGSNQGDVLNGASQAQWLLLIGLGGDDTLTGGANNDHLFGGSGGDTFVYNSVSGGSGTDYILDFASGDKVLSGSNVAVSGIGTSTVVLADNSTLIAFNGHNWSMGDFS